MICSADRYIVLQYSDILLVNVYMPCASVSNYVNVYCDTLARMAEAMNGCTFHFVIAGGDFNFDFNSGGVVRPYVTDFMKCFKLVPTNTLIPGSSPQTYRHGSLQASSLIDHFFVSDGLLDSVCGVDVLDDGCNLSDHLPVVLLLSLQKQVNAGTDMTTSHGFKCDMQRLRWDKADIMGYYNLTWQLLSDIHVPVELLTCADSVDNMTASVFIDKFYTDIVQALIHAAEYTVPKCRTNFFKFWWDEQCHILKDESVSKHRAWVAAGKPKDGEVAHARRKARSDYKLYLKQRRREEQRCFTNDLHETLVDKDFTAFWKSWNAKFGSKFSSQVVNGFNNHGSIAEAFANVFSSCVQPNTHTVNASLQQQFQSLYGVYTGDTFDTDGVINVEIVDRAVHDLKRARAAGFDGITAEHLLYSHPVICVLLSLLFRLMLMYSCVPGAFGVGMIIPLLKHDDCDSTIADNYRAITISPCISKVFEMCINSIFRTWLDSDDLQFGFKKGRGCRDAIFTLRGIVRHINTNGSTAVLCALDVSKAFDRMNHYALYIKLMERNIPKCFLDILIHWYSNCVGFVRWGNFISHQFPMLAGVRQGGVLSPTLFAIFIDSVICKLRAAGYGTFIGKFYFGCLLYADDILLVSHSLHVMQCMLDICSQEAQSLDFSFNALKSVVLRIGPRYKYECVPLVLCGSKLAYVEQTKYLGVMLVSSRSFRCSFDHVKLKFYRCFNAICYKAMNASSELVCVQLFKSICLPIALYAIEVLQPARSAVHILNHMIDRVVYRIFGCSESADIQYIRSMVDLPCVSVLAQRRFPRFIKQYSYSFSWAEVIVRANQ